MYRLFTPVTPVTDHDIREYNGQLRLMRLRCNQLTAKAKIQHCFITLVQFNSFLLRMSETFRGKVQQKNQPILNRIKLIAFFIVFTIFQPILIILMTWLQLRHAQRPFNRSSSWNAALNYVNPSNSPGHDKVASCPRQLASKA